MRALAVISALAGLAAVTSCTGPNAGHNASARRAPAPTAVNCADASDLRQRALDERRQREATRSDQERILAGSRATFFASLTTVAELKCKVTFAAADDALKPAFEAAHKAEATESFYESAVHWGEAAFISTQVVEMLTKHLAPPSR